MRRRYVMTACACVASMLAMVYATAAGAAPAPFSVLGVFSGNRESVKFRSETEILYAHTRKVGHDRTVCNNGPHSVCRTTFFFKAGTIRVAGASTSARDFSFPIVGGTGIYKGARGKVKVHVISSRRERETFQFR